MCFDDVERSVPDDVDGSIIDDGVRSFSDNNMV